MEENGLYVPQSVLDEWLEERKARLEGVTLHVVDGPTYDLVPAMHFVRESTGGGDPLNLLGRVKSFEAVEELGGEVYLDSVLFEENAFDIDRGYIAYPKKSPESEPKELSENDALEELLLQHMK